MRLFITCILLCVITSAKAQQADSLLLLEHDVYVATTIHAKNSALIRKFAYQKAIGRYKEASGTLGRVEISDSSAPWIFQQMALCSYLAGQFGDCDYALTRLEFEQPDTNAFFSYIWLKIMCLNEMQRWVEARTYGINMFTRVGKDTAWIDSMYRVSERLKLKSEKKAEALSTFLPGAGQLYAGAGGHGVINAGIILSCLGWGTYNFFQGYYITGVFTGYLLGYTFYAGGNSYAMQLVRDHNRKKTTAYVRTLNNYILESLKK